MDIEDIEDVSNSTDKMAISKWKILLFENLFLQELVGSTKDNKVDTVTSAIQYSIIQHLKKFKSPENEFYCDSHHFTYRKDS